MALFHSLPGGDSGLMQQLWAILSGDDGRLLVYPVLVGAIVTTMFLLVATKRILFPTFDPREPPKVQPTIPLVGHIISMLTQANDFYINIAKRTRGAPICTLPMLAGKMYVIYSPAMIQAAMRSKDLSFLPFAEHWSEDVVGIQKDHLALVMPHMERLSHDFWIGTSGDNLARLNVAALRELAAELNTVPASSGIEGALRIPNLSVWIRRVISLSTFRALFGKRNPLSEEDAEDYSTFENNFAGLAIGGPLKRIIGRKAYDARQRIQNKLLPYMLAGGDFDESTSDLVRIRSTEHEALGIPASGRAKSEFLTPWVATLNTIPTLFWFFTEVFSRPQIVERLREEILASGVVTLEDGGQGKPRAASLDIADLESRCPYLMACYRETLRLYNENVGNRMVLRDTVIQDPDQGGREYLLKAGTNVQWSAATTHKDPRVWGARPHDFNPDNFVDGGEQAKGGAKLTPEERAARRLCMIPFGGGKHLCPGRLFAQAENLGFVAALAVGFELHGVRVPASVGAPLGAAARQPRWGAMDPSISISRRKGWENVDWRFTCAEHKT
ncbi:uncharacterized protein PpBr36_06640 [Pyricularia pennisetigena]|uniref:uncharacterized protein n=1 Tax=Pyricularia pennisetigena TaxID=1578925 RepID=UPI001153AC63|nr:uncharacterized protein PpBr36_06640 [Pyricularia pennisetigena]TLS23782.1 hypothetical protein PpBr36_06640 [Pyricularia pennisetigena]